MPSSEGPRWPAEWRETIELRYYLSIGYLVLLAACGLGAGVYLLSADTPGALKYCVVFAAVCAATALGGYATRFDRRRSGARNIEHVRTHAGVGALKIPYSSMVFGSYALTMGLIAVGFTFGVVDSARNDAVGGIVICAALGLTFASLPLAMLTGRFARGYLLITPEGVLQRGWTFSSYLPWDAIIDVAPRYRQGPYISVLAATNASWQGQQIHKLWKQDRLPTRPEIVVPAKFLGADPAIAYAILQHYNANPATRSELSDSATIDRLHTGAFP